MRLLKLKYLFLFPAIGLSVSIAHSQDATFENGNAVMGTYTKEQKEYYEKTARLNSLTTRLEEDDKHFMQLVRAKAAEKDTGEKDRIIKQMVQVNDDRNKAADEYNKIKMDLTLRFPNQGEHLNRRYHTQVKKTVEEQEGAAGLDELLTRTRKLIEKKYAPFNDPKQEQGDHEAKIAQPAPPVEKPEQLRLEK